MIRPTAMLLLLVAPLALGQSGGDFEITRSTVDSGGGHSTSGDFSVTGAVGQPDAGEVAPTGGAFELRTGFFGAASSGDSSTGGELIFSDGFEE